MEINFEIKQPPKNTCKCCQGRGGFHATEFNKCTCCGQTKDIWTIWHECSSCNGTGESKDEPEEPKYFQN